MQLIEPIRVVTGTGKLACCDCPICGTKCTVSVAMRKESTCCHYRYISVSSNKFTFHFSYRQRTIFYYYILQNLLLKIASERLRKNYAKRLNSNKQDEVISAEWEIVIQDVLSSIGTLVHEKVQTNGKKPDIFFEIPNKSFRMIADITTVSDRNIENLYPASALIFEVQKILRDVVGDKNSFDIDLKSQTTKNLTMFPPCRIPESLHDFRIWVKCNEDAFDFGNVVDYNMSGNILQIHVVKKHEFLHGCYPARFYDAISIRNNPVFNALDRKAGSQLAEDSSALVGIFLCDGGCRILNQFGASVCEIRLPNIIDYQMKIHRHIDFVLVFSVKSFSTRDSPLYLEISLFCNRSSIFVKSNSFKLLNEEIYPYIKSNICRPTLHPLAARQEIRNNKPGCCWYFCSDSRKFSQHNYIEP